MKSVFSVFQSKTDLDDQQSSLFDHPPKLDCSAVSSARAVITMADCVKPRSNGDLHGRLFLRDTKFICRRLPRPWARSNKSAVNVAEGFQRASYLMDTRSASIIAARVLASYA